MAHEIALTRSGIGKTIHGAKRTYYVNGTLCQELNLLAEVFTAKWISFGQPIGHLVDRDPSGRARGDSSLKAAGGVQHMHAVLVVHRVATGSAGTHPPSYQRTRPS